MRLWLKKIRLDKGMTLQQLSEVVGVSWQALAYYERKERTPRPEIAIKIGKALGFDWTMFYEEQRERVS